MKFFLQGGASVPASHGPQNKFSAREDARPTKFVLAFVPVILFLTFGAIAETTNDLSEAEIKGQQLAERILEQRPSENFTNTGILQIHHENRNPINFSISFRTILTDENWQTDYDAHRTNKFTAPITIVSLRILRMNNQTNQYLLCEDENGIEPAHLEGYSILKGNETMTPFADSDFWICDLGLEFFHWPEQKILKHEMRRSRECTVLQSTNPNPSSNAYSRVVSWIDNETLGIVHAGAYDANGKLLKVFDPKSFKKVNGQWELQEMEIRNVQTGSRSRLEFDLKNQ